MAKCFTSSLIYFHEQANFFFMSQWRVKGKPGSENI